MFSVVCPVYNEAENIERLLNELQAKVSVPMEVLVVYDREEDNAVPAVRRIAARYPFEIRLVKNKFGAGALNAIKAGFAKARHEAVLVVIADLSDDLAVVDEMYRLVTEEGFDIVCGSRYMKDGRQIGGPPLKRFLSRMAGVSLHYLTGISTHDVTNSFKMYRQEFLQSVNVESKGGFILYLLFERVSPLTIAVELARVNRVKLVAAVAFIGLSYFCRTAVWKKLLARFLDYPYWALLRVIILVFFYPGCRRSGGWRWRGRQPAD